MKNMLIETGKKYRIEEYNAAISEPYIPSIREKWNGVLILAESQNLSQKNENYVNM